MKTKILTSLVLLLFSCNEMSGIENPENNGKKPELLKQYSGEVIIKWSKVTHLTMIDKYNPLVAARIHAMVNIAMHDALNSISPVFETYSALDKDNKAHPVAAVSSAAHTVLSVSFPQQKQMLDSILQESLVGIHHLDSRERGIMLGTKAGNAILSNRENDGAFQNPVGNIIPGTQPGQYQAVPPTPFVFAPFWATMKTFALENSQQFVVPPMPALNNTMYTTDYNEVKEYGDKNSAVRSEDETLSAKFWYEFSEIGWNRIAQVAVSEKKLDIQSAARLFALVNMALCDSYSAGWYSKNYYNFWRPYTAIREADNDGNDLTLADKSWEPLMNTPPAQDYPSTHSTLGNAAAIVLASVLGDEFEFQVTSTSADPKQPKRKFYRFSDAAKENANSRVVGGLHFKFSCDAGLELGQKVAEWTIQNHLRPIGELQ